jgi:hypothetical protein
LAAIIAATAAQAAPGGQIGRLLLGEFVCELPGDATGPAGIRVPEQGFSVINATRPWVSVRISDMLGAPEFTRPRSCGP